MFLRLHFLKGELYCTNVSLDLRSFHLSLYGKDLFPPSPNLDKVTLGFNKLNNTDLNESYHY